MNLQNFLANFSFLTLLLSMILYWIETSFKDFYIPFFFKVGVSESPSTAWVSKAAPSMDVRYAERSRGNSLRDPNRTGIKNKKSNFSIARYGILLSNFLLSFLLIVRWKESGHFPLSNLYESLMFLSWCFTSLHLYIDYYISGSFLVIKNGFYNKLLGAITTPSALLTNAFATFTLPKEMQETAPLVPALQSNWLMMHVTVMILSYAALILGSLLSIAFLIVTSDFFKNKKSSSSPWVLAFNSIPVEKEDTKTPPNTTFGEFSPLVAGEQVISVSEATSLKAGSSFQGGSISEDSFKKGYGDVLSPNLRAFVQVENEDSSKQLGPIELYQRKEIAKSINHPIAQTLDNLSYRILGIGFPLLTIGILSGAVWANEAWGSYWSWDPKETWALLTWLIFAIYLHTRLSKGWEGKKPAIIASFGFVIVWMCYLGVNLLGEGLHSYGWIVKS